MTTALSATALPAVRFMRVRRALPTAKSAAECLAPLAAMITLAEELPGLAGLATERAQLLLNQALAYARAAVAELPRDSDGYLLALYLQACAALLRDCREGPLTDLDDGIECLRRLRAALSAGVPEQGEADVRLGMALARRAARPSGRLADVDEAGALLTPVLGRLPPDGAERRELLWRLALLRWTRFSLFGAAERDREAAVEYAEACLALSAEDDGEDVGGGTCHIVIAWLSLTRRLTPRQWSVAAREADADFSGGAAGEILTELAQTEILADDVETALGHLRQVRAASPDVRGSVGALWALAMGARLQSGAGASAADIDRMAGEMCDVIAALPPDDPHRDWVDTVRAALLAMRDMASGAPAMGKDATDAMGVVAARFPAGHPIRSIGIETVRHGLGQQAAAAGAADAAAARLDEIVAALERMPDDPEAARALVLVGAQVLGASTARRSAMEQERLVTRFAAALGRLGQDDPIRSAAECMYWLAFGLQGSIRGSAEETDAAIDGVIRCAVAAPAGNVARSMGYSSAAGLLINRHGTSGEMRHLERAEKCLLLAFENAAPAGPFAEGTVGYGQLLLLRGRVALIRDYYDHSPARLAGAVADLEGAVALLGPGHPAAEEVSSSLGVARAKGTLQAILDGGPMTIGPGERATFAAFLDTADRVGPDHPEYPYLLIQGAAGLMMRGLAERDAALVDQAVGRFAAACAVPGLMPRERPLMLERHGFSLLTRYQRSRSPRDLANAIGRLEEARRAAGQELANPHTGDVLQSLSLAYRTRGDTSRGDVDQALTYGLAGLREHLQAVFLQDSDMNALLAARRGTNDAADMARWFTDRGKADAAVSALELGRGMVLHAATTGAGVAEALRASGQPALGDEWARRGRAEASDDLRYRVRRALERLPAEARLLSPPSVADVAAALTAADADALVYLLPRDDTGPGCGILVDRAERVRLLPLPALRTGSGSPVATFTSARRSLDAALRAAPGAEAAEEDWHAALHELCGWAWSAVIWPVLQAVPARGQRADRRIVLVPTGDLGLVPWHAARHPGGRSWYACQEAVISYAASARQFADAARRAYQPWARRPVLVCDPTGSTYHSAAGIRGLFTWHYQDGAVYGYARRRLPPDVPGSAAVTPGDVLGALLGDAGGAVGGASVLHLGCHASVETPVLGSSLDLGVGGKLAVRDLLRRARGGLAGSTPGAAAAGLVVLASCLSDVTEADYDEALTLATAFLSGGAGGVVAARWAVEESPTAIFMAMFHNYLNGPFPSPARALRQAQLWMLDAARDIPDSMPRVLRQEATLPVARGGPDLAGPGAWAAFSFQGR